MILRHNFEPPDNARLAHLCGPLDAHLRQLEAALGVALTRRAQALRIEGPAAAARQALAVLCRLYEQCDAALTPDHIAQALAAVALAHGEIVLHTRRTDLAARTPNQAQYLRHILAHDLSFGIGPAGTGKTFLAVACAVDALERSAVQRIVLTRPAVEAGERLGFLPGDMAQKVDPYLRPLYDALYELLGYDRVQRAFEKGQLEVAPLAFMRGRTLSQAFVILDEAQNTTSEQMKMFLTRICLGSRCVVTGDVSQIDLPKGRTSGLVEARSVLAGVPGIAFTDFTAEDVVRHPLVARIVRAYEALTPAGNGQ